MLWHNDFIKITYIVAEYSLLWNDAICYRFNHIPVNYVCDKSHESLSWTLQGIYRS